MRDMMSISVINSISPKAIIGENVSIGSFVTIYDNVVIGDNTRIESYCELGVPKAIPDSEALIIGPDSWIRSHSVFYADSSFGVGLVTGHRVTVRESIRAGQNLQIGTMSDLQGYSQLGDYVRLHSNVFVAQHSSIGSFVWIFPAAVLTNDPTPPSNYVKGPIIEDWVVIAASSTILPGIRIARGAVVGAMSLVTKDVPSETLVVGVPAKIKCKTRDILLKDGTGRPAYPWFDHFHRGYPGQLADCWLKSQKE